jgi:plasmid stabilization system protein ParE
MRRATLTETASRDIRKALRESGIKHGLAAKSRYALLIKKSIQALEKDAASIGVKKWDESRFMYHLRFSKNDAAINGVVVKSPSHCLFFKIGDQEIQILRLLHESSDYERHFRTG